MKTPTLPYISASRNLGALKISALYLLTGGLWIWLSDPLLARLTSNESLEITLSILKGWAFLVVTSLLLYWLVRRYTAQLFAAQERLQLALDAAELGTWQYAFTSGTIYFDERARAHFSLTTSPHSRADLLAHVHPDDRTRMEQGIETALASGQDTRYLGEHRILSPDGTEHWLAVSARLYFQGSGAAAHPVWMVGATQDITKRKHAEEQLRRAEHFAQATLDALPTQLCVLDEKGTILFVNRAWREFAAANPPVPSSFFLGDNYLQVCNNAVGRDSEGAAEFAAGLRAVMKGELDLFKMEYPCHAPFEQRWFISRVTHFSDEQSIRLVVAHQNITDRKRAENALGELAANMAMAQRIGHVGSWETELDPQGKLVEPAFWSDESFRIFGLEPNSVAITSKFFIHCVHPEDRTKTLEPLLPQNPNLTEGLLAYRILLPNGSVRHIQDEFKIVLDSNTGKRKVVGILHDVTERMLAEQQLRENAERLKGIIESAMDGIISVDENLRVVLFNSAAEKIFRCCAADAIGQPLDQFIPADLRAAHANQIRTFGETEVTNRGQYAPNMIKGVRADGQEFPVEASISHIETTNGKLYTVILRDITVRQRAEQEVRYQANLLANVSDAIISTGLDYKIKSWNHGAERIYGWSDAEMLGKPFLSAATIEYENTTVEASHAQLVGDGHWEGITRQTTASGAKRYIASSVTLLRDSSNVPTGIVAVNRDISETMKQQSELAAIAGMSSALRTSMTRNEILNIVLEQARTLLAAQATAFVRQNPKSGQIVVEAISGTLTEAQREQIPQSDGVSAEVLETHTPYLNNNLLQEPISLDVALLGDLRAVACVPLLAQDQIMGALWLVRAEALSDGDMAILASIADIAASAILRAQLLERTEQQVERLGTLHTLDTAIASSFDLRLTLNLLVERLTNQLGMDAAAVLLLNPTWLTVEYAAARGFRRPNVRPNLRLGHGLAGRVALQREPIAIADLAAAGKQEMPLSVFDLSDESFVSYYAVPLMIKGQVKGVLELYSRSPIPFDDDWIQFGKLLAQQTAIAIDNVELFNDLQRSNLELGLAYDATIEGWSRALDLRDRETEGHTLRVTELTVQVAERMGIPGEQLVHIRRGALLHDIGKMGVPDMILLKPDKLTDAEWEVMRKHPGYAYEMLAPIAYLKPALDIPHYHHEKWDGTGYPEKLAGEQIPLAARLFAVVDVWDALTSDRPYRPAWSTDKTREYILTQRGKHFDPNVVDVFLPLIADREFRTSKDGAPASGHPR